MQKRKVETKRELIREGSRISGAHGHNSFICMTASFEGLEKRHLDPSLGARLKESVNWL